MNQTVVGNTSQTFSPTGANGYKLQINDVLLNTNVGLTAWSGVLNPTSAPLIVAGNVTQTNAHPTVSAILQLDGTASGNQINGIISDAASGAPLRLAKSNSSTWSLSGPNSYTGPTTISAGTLTVNGNQSTATGPVAVSGTSTLGGTGRLGGTVTVDTGANLAPGVASAGTLSIAGDLNISAPVDGGNGKLRFELGSVAASDRIAVTGALIIGTDKLDFSDFVFTPLIGLNNGTYKLITSSGISGTLDPVSANLTGAIGVGTGTLQMNGNDIELVVTGFGGLAGYSLWASTNAPSTTPTQDQDGDGVSNAVEYVLGGTIGGNDLGKLPGISTSGGNMIFSFKRDQASIDGTTVVVVEVGNDLTAWPSPSPYAVPDVAAASNPGITVVKDLPTGFDTITLTLPQGLESKKFARLKVVVTP
jgi:autotransporter-associated beta strand protein